MFKSFEISDPRFEADGLRSVTVKSAALRGRGDITLWSPASRVPVGLVILLHGVYGSHWSWAWQGGAHRTATRMTETGQILPMALVMPSDGLRGDGSGYARHGDGVDFERWIVEEVPLAARIVFPDITNQTPMFIAGLSMGGFGALRLGAKYADRFRGVSGHSSVTELSQLGQFMEEDPGTFGIEAANTSSLAAICAARSLLPALRFDCGVSDPLLGPNRDLHQALAREGIQHKYEEFAGGHEWSYWEKHLEDTLRFFNGLV